MVDGCAAATDDDHNAALNSCAQIFGDAMEVDEVLKRLRGYDPSAAKPVRANAAAASSAVAEKDIRPTRAVGSIAVTGGTEEAAKL